MIAGLGLIPAVVTLSKQGIEAKWWWGKKRLLLWSSIATATYDRAKHETSLYGRDGTVLRHTQYHVDAARFQIEIAHHVENIEEAAKNPGSGINALRL